MCSLPVVIQAMMYQTNEEDAHSDGEMFDSPVDIHSQPR